MCIKNTWPRVWSESVSARMQSFQTRWLSEYVCSFICISIHFTWNIYIFLYLLILFQSFSLLLLQLIAPNLPCMLTLLAFSICAYDMCVCVCVSGDLDFMCLLRDECIHDSIDVDSLRLFNYGKFRIGFLPFNFVCSVPFRPYNFSEAKSFVKFPNKFLLYTQFLLIYNVCIIFLSSWTILRMWYVWWLYVWDGIPWTIFTYHNQLRFSILFFSCSTILFLIFFFLSRRHSWEFFKQCSN